MTMSNRLNKPTTTVAATIMWVPFLGTTALLLGGATTSAAAPNVAKVPSLRASRNLRRPDPFVPQPPKHHNQGLDNADAVFSYLDLDHPNETTAEQSMRFLSSSSSSGKEGPYFKPLECGVPACNINTTWTSENYDPNKGTVVIPCGTCVWMDFQEQDKLVLPYGIDIQGHWYFEDGYNMTIETPFVLIQGLLDIQSTGAVTGKPLVEFVITDGDRKKLAFLPAHNNERVCPDQYGRPGLCDAGFRSVVVAGGKVNTRGLPPSCATWTHLEDVATIPQAPIALLHHESPSPEDPSNQISPFCQGQSPYIQETFDNGSGHWTGGYGAAFEVVDGFFRTTNRKYSHEHGPTIDLQSVQDCLVPNQVYLFSARVRMWDPLDPDDSLLPCATDGQTNCLELSCETKAPHGRAKGRTLQKETQADRYRNNEWENFYATIEFSEEELDTSNVYHLLHLRGVHEKFNIDMDNVTFALPPSFAASGQNDMCDHNLVMNGDAEQSPIHPYPMEASGGHLTLFSLISSSGNRAFRMRGRERDSDALVYNLRTTDCITTGARYRISARVYAVSKDVAVSIEIKYRILFDDGRSSIYTAAECPPSQRNWERCESMFAIVEDVEPESIETVRFWFETVDAPTTDYIVDEFVIEVANAAKSGIIVPSNGIQGCWDEGAEILITSHTTKTDDSQVRRLVNPPVPLGNGMVRLELDDHIIVPVTAQHDEGLFPVEVALLSRNIRFRAEEDLDDSLLGGHFMVLRTPGVDQHIEGCEFQNFGQQGQLGRYPIHLHLCKNAYSVIAKNLVRGSNQRCVVIHGSHNTTIVENIAYDTFGHCFMTEDGGEIDNKFIRNLGSNTKMSSRLVRDGESDVNNPATFWTANPTNEWFGNVAAGSKANGYWIELLEHIRGPTAFLDTSIGMNPRRSPLSLFLDNVAHSNYRHGIKMYPHGLLPEVTAVFENFRAYKNRLDGIFFRNVINTVVKGGIFSDNRIQADFDRSNTIVMDGTRLIASTNRYNEIVDMQGIQAFHNDRIVGLELHLFTRNPAEKGLTVQNVVFEGFDETKSEHTALVEFDRESDDPWSGKFDYWTTFRNITITGDSVPFHFDFTQALEHSYKGLYLVDLDSSLRPPSSINAIGTSTVIADSPEMKVFTNLSRCDSVPEHGYLYCQDTCLSSITFAVDPGQTADLRLRVQSLTEHKEHLFDGSQDIFVNDDVERHVRAMTDIDFLRYFSASLPVGEYRAEFVNIKTGETMWPTFVEKMLEPSLCNSSFDMSDVSMEIPSPSKAECRDLIRNGDMEDDDFSAPYWLQYKTELEVAVGRGINGSNALTETDQRFASGSVGQYVDVRCLTRGETYLIQAWVHLERDGLAYSCEGGPACPKLVVRMRTQVDQMSVSYRESEIDITSSFAGPVNRKGWNLLQGTITVDETMENATNVAVYVQRGRSGAKLFLDNVSMTRVKKDCSDLVFNGNMSEPNTLFWDVNNGDLDLVSIKGENELRHSFRKSSVSAITQRIQTGCMKSERRFIAKAKVRVLTQQGAPFRCNPTKFNGEWACPRMKLRAFYNYGQEEERSFSHPEGFVASADHGVTRDGWQTISGIFSATEYDETADQSVLFVDGPAKNMTVVMKDVSITPVQKDCGELICNGDAEAGETAEMWRLPKNNEETRIEVVKAGHGNGNHAFHVIGRKNPVDGIVQGIDSRCMKEGSTWRVKAQMKLRSSVHNKPVTCNPHEDKISNGACPSVQLSAIKDGRRTEGEHIRMTNTDMIWEANQFNKFETAFQVPEGLVGGEGFVFGFQHFNPDWELVIDDISVTPLE